MTDDQTLPSAPPAPRELLPAKTLPVGSLWAVSAPQDERVRVMTPSGQEITVVAYDGAALVVMTEPGEYSAGDERVTAVA